MTAPPPQRTYPSATIEEIPDQDAPVPAPSASGPAQAAPRVAAPPAIAARPLPYAPPNFKLQAPIESDSVLDFINKRILESKIVLTLEELFALSPNLRRHWKDQTSTKRVTIAYAGTSNDVETVPYDAELDGVESYFFREVTSATNVSRDLITAPAVLPLRYLDCRVAHDDKAFIAEGVVDNGSQMVLISKAFWEALGKPMDFDRRVSLEAANNTSALTLGLCADLDVNIGGLSFLLQAQVVEDAPFSLLLGRPFLALAGAKEETFYDGASVMTLNCRNTKRAVRIPTRARRAPRPDSMPLDF